MKIDAADPAFLVKLLKLKDEPRTGWMENGVTYPESVAAHSFGVAFLTMLFGDAAGIDRDHAIKLGLVHDIQEEITGDIPSGDLSPEEKQRKKERERDALEQLLDRAGGDTGELAALWDEFNTRQSAEARFVKDMEELDMALQAYIYATEKRATANKDLMQKNNAMKEFFNHAEQTVQRDDVRHLIQQLREKALKEHTVGDRG